MSLLQLAEMKVGKLCRKGVNVYYAYSLKNGYIESLNREWLIVELLKEMEI